MKQCADICPGFGWDGVSFHKKPVGLTQTSQSNRIFDAMRHHAQYLCGGGGWGRVICYLGASWALGGEQIALCRFLLSVLLLFSSPLAVLLNCSYPNPQVLPFSSDVFPIPPGIGVRNQPHAALLPAGAKPWQSLLAPNVGHDSNVT